MESGRRRTRKCPVHETNPKIEEYSEEEEEEGRRGILREREREE